MTIVEACIDAGAKDFFFKILSVGKRVGGIRYRTADHKSYFVCAEKTFQRARHRAGNASVRGQEFRMIRRDAERFPRWICNGQWVSGKSRILNGRHWPPKAEVVLGIHTADE